MRKYTLLRNNQQSGPYTIEDLKAMGLKVYDLIWIEGRSAAWLYAEEVEELAPFTPKIKDIVEESFLEKRATAKIPSILDQYSNKSTTANNTASTASTITKEAASVNSLQNKTETLSNAVEKIISREDVYAETENLSNSIIASNHSHLTKEKDAIVQNVSPVTIPEQPVKEKKAYEPATINHYMQDEPSVKYARSLDDIKQEYVSKVLGKATLTNKKSIPVFMLLGVGVLLLIGVGILIGIMLEKNTQPLQTATAIPVQKPVPEKKVIITENKPSSFVKKPTTVNNDENEMESFANDDFVVNEPPRVRKQNTTAVRNETTNKSKGGIKNTDTNDKPEKIQKPQNDVTAVVKKQTDNNRNANRENLRGLISISSNNYRKAGLFGGLKDITVTASNNSSHLIDLAVVEVRYILGNGKLFKTDVLYFKNIAPKSSVSMKAANSSRGARVESKLTLVTSKSAESVSDISYLTY
jgi:hypothetical protein